MNEFADARWIWAPDNTRKNDWVYFYRDFSIRRPQKSTLLNIAVDTKYHLFLNGKQAVFDGGLNRESLPGQGYFDQVDIARFLKTGTNRICIKAWFWGNQGRNIITSSRAGLLLASPSLGLYSNNTWTAIRNPAHDDKVNPLPFYLYGGHNIRFNANKAVDVPPGADLRAHPCAAEYGAYGDAPWGQCRKRPIPLFRFSRISRYRKTEHGNVCHLPYAMQVTPYLKVMANGSEVINIRTDRHVVNGGPGDDHHSYRGHCVEYVCKKGLNEFESLYWMFGEKVIYTIPKGVRILSLGYRESGFDTALLGCFRSSDKLADTLVQKSMRTLYVCMRENFMDCPDRERGQWIGDVSVQVPQVPYVFDSRALLLVRKAISDFINLRKGDVLKGNVPGAHS